MGEQGVQEGTKDTPLTAPSVVVSVADVLLPQDPEGDVKSQGL
jgi:hypothetical protein